jgi:hypothetical protein
MSAKRPTRTVAGITWSVDEINAMTQPIQDAVLKEMQLESVLGGASAQVVAQAYRLSDDPTDWKSNTTGDAFDFDRQSQSPISCQGSPRRHHRLAYRFTPA